jgi:hypothetical protein
MAAFWISKRRRRYSAHPGGRWSDEDKHWIEPGGELLGHPGAEGDAKLASGERDPVEAIVGRVDDHRHHLGRRAAELIDDRQEAGQHRPPGRLVVG